jgi:peptidoglycan hydrolase-like protein with peptidoglycan-binding domain
VAAYLSFAANNPTWANNSLQTAVRATKADPYSEGWLVDVLERLTFAPNVAIYPGRYDKIRPTLERLYGIDLPDFSAQLGGKNWLNTEVIQQILVDLGRDLGASGPNSDGVDGQWGGKSRLGLAEFQRKHGLEPDGWPDPETNEALLRAREALDKIKSDNNGAIPAELKEHVEALVALTVSESAREYFEKHHQSVKNRD